MERDFWQAIIVNNYAFPAGYDAVGLTNELLEYLASPDEELRDRFAYNILARWIVRDGLYSPQDLRDMMNHLLANLTLGLGEQNTDSVFLRSYSALVLSLIVFRHNRAPFLDEGELAAILDGALDYWMREIDLRGYVVGKGLAAPVAHVADLLRFLARCPILSEVDLLRILDAIADRLLLEAPVIFHFDEDDRLALVVIEVVRRDLLPELNFGEWLGRFNAWQNAHENDIRFDFAVHATAHNVKHFLRALYCRLELSGVSEQLADFHSEVLATIKRYSI